MAEPGPVRVVALDLGERRIGVAATDELGMAAHPLPYIPKGRARADDLARIGEVVRARDATLVIVGHPIGLRGRSGPAARRVEQFVEALRAVLPVPCVLRDERFTTVEAERLLVERGLGRAERRQRVDSAAAAVLLEGWLEEQRSAAGGPPRGEPAPGGEPAGESGPGGPAAKPGAPLK